MPDPTQLHDQPTSEAVKRKLRQLAEFEEAGAFGRPSEPLGDVRDALFALAVEVRNLRLALEPSSSPLIHGDAAVREFKRLQEKHHA